MNLCIAHTSAPRFFPGKASFVPNFKLPNEVLYVIEIEDNELRDSCVQTEAGEEKLAERPPCRE